MTAWEASEQYLEVIHKQDCMEAPAENRERQVPGLYIQAQQRNPVSHAGRRQPSLIQNYGYLRQKGRRGESRSLIFFFYFCLKNGIIK